MRPISCTQRAWHAHAMGIVMVAACFSATSTHAARVHGRASDFGFADISAFELQLAATDLEADYDDGPDETLRLRRIGIGFFESLGETVRLGARAGRIGFDQSGREATEGRDPSGHFAGLEFSGAWPARSAWRAALEANWRYTSGDEADDEGSVEVEWQTIELRPAVWFAPTDHLAFRFGVSAIAVDGTEKRRNGVRRTVDFKAEETAGAFAGLEYHRTDGDMISLRLRGGNPAGLALSFEHRY